uniref:Fibronectin type-III domain-containing protein n=1 Tax=Denticeps clupeoides TaxID=299321 RepID=A0AAY4B5V5_9TELE
TWDAPAVDGGAPVNNYLIERREISMRAYKTVTSKCSKTSCKIDNLEEGMMYYFRVLPENIYGVGEASETGDAVLVCEVPLPPRKLDVTDITKSTVTIGWEKPDHDGGSRLTAYIVEACKFGTDKWLKVSTLKTTDLEFKIVSLNENEQYLFRIRAVNSRGASEPKELVTPVTVQEQRGILTLCDNLSFRLYTMNEHFTYFMTFQSVLQLYRKLIYQVYPRKQLVSWLAKPLSWSYQ